MIKPELTPATNKQLWKLNDLSGKIFHHTTTVGVLEEKAGVEKSLLEGEAGFNVTLPLTKDQAANFINILIKKVDMLEEYSQLLKKEIEKRLKKRWFVKENCCFPLFLQGKIAFLPKTHFFCCCC